MSFLDNDPDREPYLVGAFYGFTIALGIFVGAVIACAFIYM